MPEGYPCTDDYSPSVTVGIEVFMPVAAVAAVAALAMGRARLAWGAAPGVLGGLVVWLVVGGPDWFDCALGV